MFFDTSAAVDWLKGESKLKDMVDGESVTVSVVTVYELLWAARRKDKRASESVHVFLENCSVVPVTESIARRAASLKMELAASGKEGQMADLMIAATAELERLPLVTADKDFLEIRRFADLDVRTFR